MPKPFSLALLVTSTLLPIAFVPQVRADPVQSVSGADDRLEEIVVTATKRAEPLLDVPVAVSAITADQIQSRGFTQFADYLNSVPGVYLEDAGPGQAQIRIRGLSVGEDARSTTTAVYFGETVTSVGVNQGGKANPRLVDIDRVEVLRGPQGTLFGANALAGVVRIIPAAPDLQSYVAKMDVRGFTTAHSKDESYHVEGIFNLPLVQDRFALRFVAYNDRVAGYINNAFGGQPAIDYSAGVGAPAGTLVIPEIPAFSSRDVNTEKTTGGRVSASWQASEALRFDLSYTKQDVTLDGEPNVDPTGGYSRSRALDFFHEADYHEHLDIASLVGRYELSSVELFSATSWVKFAQDRKIDYTPLAVAAPTLGLPLPWEFDNDSPGEVFTEELRVQSRAESPFQWTAGVFYMDENSDLRQAVVDYSCPTCLPAILTPGIGNYAFLTDGHYWKRIQRSVFGEVSYDLTSRWTAGLGARYLTEDVTATTADLFGLLADGFTPEEKASGSSKEFNPSAYVRFKPIDDLTLYLQAARGFRGGDPNTALPSICDGDVAALGVKPITDADTLWNYELGMKSLMADGRLSLNLAVYKADWSGIQLGVVLPTCFFGVTVNGGDATAKGVEAELVYRPAAAWQFNLSAAFHNNEIDSAKPATGFSPGDRLPNSSEKNGSAGVQYNFVLGGTRSGFARADYTYVGNVLTDTAQLLPSYSTINARLGFEQDKLQVELYGRNLADKRGIASANNPGLGGHQTLIRPRELGVEVRYSFR